MHHIGFPVDDVEKEVAGLKSQGVEVLAEGGSTYAYVRSGGPDSMIFEFMNRGVYNLIKEKGLDGIKAMMEKSQSTNPTNDESP